MPEKLALVVDDSRVARMMLCKLLQTAGFSVVEQGRAEDALSWLQTAQPLPDVIFMDLMMPGMDGLTATQKIKINARWRDIPVVLCTSNDSEADKLSAQQNGILALLSKPPEAQQLNSILESVSVPDDVAEETSLSDIGPTIEKTVTTPSIEEIVAQVEQQLLPGWLQQSEQLSQQITQQLAESIARQLIDEKLEGLSERLASAVQQQVNREFETSVQQQLDTHAAQMKSVLSEKAADAVEVAVQNLSQSSYWQQQVKMQTEQWLASHNLSIEQQLLATLQPQIDSLVAQQLAALPDTTTTLLQALQDEFAQQQLMQKQLLKRERMSNILMLVALAASVLALLQINLF